MTQEMMEILQNKKLVGQILKLWRLSLGMSRTEVGKKVGLCQSSIQSYEEGLIVHLTPERLAKFCKAYEVTLKELFNDSVITMAKKNIGVYSISVISQNKEEDTKMTLTREEYNQILEQRRIKKEKELEKKIDDNLNCLKKAFLDVKRSAKLLNEASELKEEYKEKISNEINIPAFSDVFAFVESINK